MVNSVKSITQRAILRWCGWFCLGNAVLFWIISLRYWQSIPWLHSVDVVNLKIKTFSLLFFVNGYLGHLSVLAFLPCLICIPLTFIIPKKYIIIPIAIFLSALLAIFLLTDSITYSLYHFHLQGILLDFVIHAWNEQIFEVSSLEYFTGVAIVIFIISIEIFYAYLLWRFFILKNYLCGYGAWLALALGLNSFFAYGSPFFLGDQFWGHMLIHSTRVLPLYAETLDALLPKHQGISEFEYMTQKDVIQPANNNTPVHYPLHAVQCNLPRKPMNLVIIAIDTWRFDMLNAIVTPHMAQFAKHAWTFTQHSSGGNCTGPGIFSLFYGMPAYYWSAMSFQHKSPLLIDELTKNHYRIGIFSSGTLKYPALYKNVFQSIKDLHVGTQGKTPLEGDQLVTKEFQAFLATANKQPFFSFLFYDSAHSFCMINDFKPFQPAIKNCERFFLTMQSDPVPYFNRYKNALLLVDQQVQHVLTLLKQHNLLNNTVVVITGDHGEEFNDNHQHYWGHAGNFTRYQVQTPLIVYWPGEKPRVFQHPTSHYDIAPTLMKNMLGCSSPATDYSFGKDLLSPKIMPYLIANSYMDLGIIENNKITTIRSGGAYQIDSPSAQPMSLNNLNIDVMQKVLQDLNRFTKDPG